MLKKTGTFNKKKLIIAFVIVSVIVASVLFYRFSRFEVLSARAKRGSLVESVYGVGTVIARKVYQVKTSVPGQISTLAVKEGQAVSAGDLLLVFDEGAKFRAPFDGTVTSISFKLGELVTPQVSVLTLMNLKDVYLEVSLEQQSALRIKTGQSAVATFESLRDERFRGVVDAIYSREGQFIVRIDLEKMPESILPAMTADVSIEITRKENALLVPLAAISVGRVLVVRNGKRIKTTLQIGAVDGQWAEVQGGDIQPDDEVLIKAK